MEIVTRNGKDYLISWIAKVSNNKIDAQNFFLDIKEMIISILKKYNQINKTKYTFIDKNQYGGNLQSMYNRFSGSYFSPSFLKNYMTNPALCVFSSLFSEDVNDVTAIGTTFHKILEIYYQLPPEERDRNKLISIMEKEMPEGQDKDKLNEYIQGFIQSGDYLGGSMNDKALKCDTEKYGRINELYLPKYDYMVPCAVSYIVDRIDYRDSGNYIIDYKTGHPKPSAVTFDGYLGSMLLYKWAMESELNTEIKGSYLLCPGNKEKFMKLDFSEENERKMIEIIEQFYSQFKLDTSRRTYAYTDKGYFTSDDAKRFKETMNDSTIWMAKIPVELYIGEHEESLL